MDATSAPHRIPPEMPQYGETHHIFEMMQVTRLLLTRLPDLRCLTPVPP